jgi:hypothetical protein
MVQDRICVPEIDNLHETILKEAHDSDYSIHPRSTKMYQDLKLKYWWYGLKRDVAAHVAMCDVCRRVKAEHQRPTGLLHPLKIPEWKWEEIGMDFITRLPRTSKGYDSIWVIVDRLTKWLISFRSRVLIRDLNWQSIYSSDCVSTWCIEEDRFG